MLIIKWLTRRWKNLFCDREHETEVRNNAILVTMKINILSLSHAKEIYITNVLRYYIEMWCSFSLLVPQTDSQHILLLINIVLSINMIF